MFKKAFFSLIIASFVLGGVVLPQAPAKALPTCSDIKGGNVTFIVCEGKFIDHFWSNTKIYVAEQKYNAAGVWIEDTQQKWFVLVENQPSGKIFLTHRPDKYLELTYLGKGEADRALIKVDSNTTYQDSFWQPTPQSSQPVPQPQPDPQVPPTPPAISLELELTTDKNTYYSDEDVYVTAKTNQTVAWIQIIDLSTMQPIQDCFNANTCAVVKTDGYHQYDGASGQMTILAFSAIANLYCDDISQGNTCGGHYTTSQVNLAIIPTSNNLPIQLEKPVITYPTNNEKIYNNPDDNFFYGWFGAKTELKAKWNEVPEADRYEIAVEQDVTSCPAGTACPAMIVFEEKWHTGSFSGTVTPNVASYFYPGYYRFKIKAHNNADQESEWSDYVYFTIYNHGDKTDYNSAGDDGLYSGFKNNTITHNPTGIKATIENYDSGVVYLRLENANRDLIYVRKDKNYFVYSLTTGHKLRFYYEDINEEHGVFVRLITEEIDPSYAIQARDAKRLSDLKQIQTALELYYSDNGVYPVSGPIILGFDVTCLGQYGWGFNQCQSPYMGYVPKDPKQGYIYMYEGWSQTYVINAQLEGTIAGLSGIIYATPSGISM